MLPSVVVSCLSVVVSLIAVPFMRWLNGPSVQVKSSVILGMRSRISLIFYQYGHHCWLKGIGAYTPLESFWFHKSGLKQLLTLQVHHSADLPEPSVYLLYCLSRHILNKEDLSSQLSVNVRNVSLLRLEWRTLHLVLGERISMNPQ